MSQRTIRLGALMTYGLLAVLLIGVIDDQQDVAPGPGPAENAAEGIKRQSTISG